MLNWKRKLSILLKNNLQRFNKAKLQILRWNRQKHYLTNGIKSAFDSARGQIEVFDQFKELDENFTAETIIAGWEAVTKEDVKKMASEIQLEIVYLLSGKEANLR